MPIVNASAVLLIALMAAFTAALNAALVNSTKSYEGVSPGLSFGAAFMEYVTKITVFYFVLDTVLKIVNHYGNLP